MTYDDIKPKARERNMFEKFIDFSDNVYKKVFDNNNNSVSMPCQCKSE